MTHGSTFTGIGGFDLAAQWMGWKNVWQIEQDPWCRSKLEKHFPEAERYEDVKKWREYGLKPVDIITGGFPCQPHSLSGRRTGRQDDRYLWPEQFEIIKYILPDWVLPENVPGILSIENGLVFDLVASDLESIGYEVQPLIIPAAAVGAKDIRERVFWLGRLTDKRLKRLQGGGLSKEGMKRRLKKKPYGRNLTEYLQIYYGRSGIINPTFLEIMRGFPIGWTE